jgi:hypothetical protein
VSETLQFEETVELEATELHDVPKLLIEWSSPWEEFVTSIRPALARSTSHLAGEAPYGIFPYRGMLTSLLIEAFLIFVVIVVPMKIAQLRPYAPPKLTGHEVIYYSGDELPRTEDLGGAQSGLAGRAGGKQAHHRTQMIKVARGGSLVQKVVDAPNLKLPATRDAVANLLAIRSDPGPPPAEGLRSSRSVLIFPTTVVAPAPSVMRELTRGSLSLESVVPPVPSVARDKALIAPTLNSAVVAPAPSISRDQAPAAPALGTNVIAPAPRLSSENIRSAPALTANVIPPAPGVVSRETSRSPVQMTDAAVIRPPVSSPERETTRNPKLALPAPSVVAPPPSSDTSADLRRLASGMVTDPSKSVVPPPPSPGSGSLMSSLIGKIFGTTDVVPPPPNLKAGSGSGNVGGVANGRGDSPGANIVPPPPAVNASPSGTPRGIRSGLGASPGTSVVPPPPSVSGNGQGIGTASDAAGSGGKLLASNLIPPPPSIGDGAAISGPGRGTKGVGFGGPMDSGSVLAPPAGGGSGAGSGVIVSSQPGSKIGVPSTGNPGSLSMSPSGGDKPGLGGSGGGTGIGRGDGPGSGLNGTGSGAGRSGTGRGSDPSARGGISPTPGPGGAGNATSGTPAIPGVSVSGGSTIVTLPSFGSDGSGSAPTVPGRSSVKEQQGPAITIVASSRSGGAFNFYGKLPGDNYTVYLDTSAGIVVMQFADPTSVAHHYGTLTGPQALRTDLPADLPHARLVVACTLDASGNLKNIQVHQPGPAAMTAKVMASLPGWKFRPATRAGQPVEVNALLGFGIDTNDRY